MRITSVVALFADLPQAELTSWVARGWVLPDGRDAGQGAVGQGDVGQGDAGEGDAGQGDAEWEFLEIDVARVRLIHDLRRSMGIGEETMPLVLSLLDQVYALRGTLRDLLRVLEAQPEDVRTSVLAAMRRG
jgi:chaperone modulatory protein CbpM